MNIQEEVDERQDKQQLLRTEILEKGYNTQKFKLFMNTRKQDGCNIDNWTLTELKDMILIFKNSYDVQVQVKDSLFQNIQDDDQHFDDQVQNELDSLNITQVLAHIDAVEQDQTHNNDDKEEKDEKQKHQEVIDELGKSIFMMKSQIKSVHKTRQKNNLDVLVDRELSFMECQKIQEQIESHIYRKRVKLRNIKVVKKSYLLFFTNKTLEMDIIVDGWKVNRNYEDLEWLIDMVKYYFKYKFVPNIPQKKIISMKKVNEKEQHQYLFSQFLNYILYDPDITQTSFCISFFSENRSDFDNTKQQEKVEYQIENVNDLLSRDGQVILTRRSDWSIENLDKSMKEFHDIFNNIQPIQRQILEYQNRLSQKYIELSQTYQQLQQQSEQGFKVFRSQQLLNMESVFRTVSNWYLQMAQQTNNLSSLQNIYDYHYNSSYVENIKQIQKIIKVRNDQLDSLKKHMNGPNRNDELYLLQFYNYQVRQQICKGLQIIEDNNCMQFKQLIIEQLQQNNETNHTLEQQLKLIADLQNQY